MDVLKFVLITCIVVIGTVSGQYCTPQPITNCSITGANTKKISIDNQQPTERCSSVMIGNATYIFDSLNITKVWVTLTNPNKVCTTDSLNSLAASMNSTDQIIIIELQQEFLRLVFVSLENNVTKVVPFQKTFEDKLRIANLTLYPIFNNPNALGRICLNGGRIDETYTGAGYRCICPKNSLSFGSRCEYKDRVLNSSIYFFNIFPDPQSIRLTFSLFSNGIKKSQSLLTIKTSKFIELVDISFNESLLQLNISGVITSKTFAIDSVGWNEFFLDMNTTFVTLKVQTVSLNHTFSSALTDSFLSNYLVLNADNSSEFNICIKNLKVNSQVIDLNNMDGYESCCIDRCSQCKNEQDCACVPFMSESHSKCYCKFEYSTSGSGCTKVTGGISQILPAITTTSPLNAVVERVDFKFRSLSISGTVVTFNSSQLGNISISIIKTNLTLAVENGRSSQINYNVSDGLFHLVTLHLKKYSLEMILDDNGNYSCSLSNLLNVPLDPMIYVVSLGPLLDPFKSDLNPHSTCFSSIRINSTTDKQYDFNIGANANLSPNCSDGPRCSSGKVTCPNYQVCNDNEWQNTKCLCITNFTSTSSSQCIFYKCVNNPCQNNGDCYFNNVTNDYSCLCKSPYTGNNCETNPILAASLWWIAILIVLLLLLILLIILVVYCCCCRKRQKTESPIISKIHENTVIYNDQAGECDYNGPPINYALMKEALYNNKPATNAPVYSNPTPDLLKKKIDLDKNNNDLVLDHPLEYGFEGYNSDGASVSSLGSKSTNSQLNTLPLDNSNTRFNHLQDLYK